MSLSTLSNNIARADRGKSTQWFIRSGLTMAFSCWMGRTSSFWALRKACCRSLLLIGCRFKCFWGSPHRPPWARGHVWTTWPLGRFSLTLHFIVTTHFALYSQTLQYQEEGVLLQCYFEFFCTAWGLNEWRAGYGCTLCSLGCTASWLHCILVALYLGCTASPLCTASNLHWSNVLTLNCV